MHVASLDNCRELYELSGWEYDDRHRLIEKVWIEHFSTSEMGEGHPDYRNTKPENRRQYHVGEFLVRDNPKNQVGIPEHVPWGWANKYYEGTVKRSVPAYDLGYLLRKLPARTELGDDPGCLAIIALANGSWVAQYNRRLRAPTYSINEDTPEDAACKLAIELFKQGILKREANNV